MNKQYSVDAINKILSVNDIKLDDHQLKTINNNLNKIDYIFDSIINELYLNNFNEKKPFIKSLKKKISNNCNIELSKKDIYKITEKMISQKKYLNSFFFDSDCKVTEKCKKYFKDLNQIGSSYAPQQQQYYPQQQQQQQYYPQQQQQQYYPQQQHQQQQQQQQYNPQQQQQYYPQQQQQQQQQQPQMSQEEIEKWRNFKPGFFGKIFAWTPDTKFFPTKMLDYLGLLLGIVGFVPGIGEVSDAIDLLMNLLRGDFVSALFTAISLVPVVGSFIGLPGKYLTKFLYAEKKIKQFERMKERLEMLENYGN